ncbi:MAG TPA: DNA-directed RNA polymerase subunit omega [Planktothrix sp. UBA8407]|jgi:DNA-directed RNA polymerase, subunit K/omega|nr:DNA-directed RNA polymerase subunit omega [Planktothrix sp. UBA8402]HAO10199.1 DNA-directed RNA polymerase subunit omega [Planktothrix sp. UBA8407]HBK20962.1 DNA-directed RNA polymerase subunit omega [Planktothrix sp. UBA10369]
MQKRFHQIDSLEITRRAADLVSAATNRYRITVQVANRAKRCRYEDFDSADENTIKPVLRAIIEMSDELTENQIIADH